MKNKGITLIALIVTIIVLLILAGISIGLVLGDNGVLNKAQKAKANTTTSSETEYVELAYSSAYTNNSGGKVTKNDIQTELDNLVGTNKTIVTGSSNFKVIFIETNNKYSISPNGKVSKLETVSSTDVYTAVCDNGTLVFSNNIADIDTYLSNNNTMLADGYEIENILDKLYDGSQIPNSPGEYNWPKWSFDYNIQYAIFLNEVVPNNTAYWFNELTALELIYEISNLNTCNVKSMKGMFTNNYSLLELDVSGFDTSSCTDMSYMFNMFDGQNDVTTLDVSGFDTSNVTNMAGMFSGYGDVTYLDVSGFDTSNVTNMAGMFTDCYSLTTLDVTNFDTSKVTNMGSMFYNCSNIETFDLSNFDTSNVTNMEGMFCYCNNVLTTLDLSSFDTSKVTNISHMFKGCLNLEKVYVSDKWTIENVTEKYDTFNNCSKIEGENGTRYGSRIWNNTVVNDFMHGTYARIDTEEAPGYFTEKR